MATMIIPLFSKPVSVFWFFSSLPTPKIILYTVTRVSFLIRSHCSLNGRIQHSFQHTWNNIKTITVTFQALHDLCLALLPLSSNFLCSSLVPSCHFLKTLRFSTSRLGTWGILSYFILVSRKLSSQRGHPCHLSLPLFVVLITLRKNKFLNIFFCFVLRYYFCIITVSTEALSFLLFPGLAWAY